MKTVFLYLIIVVLNVHAQQLIEYDYELDAYYSNVSAFIDLDSANELTDASGFSEAQIYKQLALNTFSPNIFLVELSLNPMPIAGLYFRSNHEELYEQSKIEDFNIVKSVTAGFEEPYALSFFIGRMMVFEKGKENNQQIGKNRAYIGYLVSIGNNTIKDNELHQNNWVNFEFKLKGTRELKDKDLDWSFRLGMKANSNSSFADIIYIGVRRSSIDYKKPVWSLLYNSAFSSMVAVSMESFKMTEAEVFLEKKFPLSWSEKMSFGLGVGYLYTSGEKYYGDLRDDGINNHQVLFRPNLKW